MSIFRLLFVLVISFSLTESTQGQPTNYKRGIGVELAGSAIGYAVEFEQVFVNRRSYLWSFRVGVGLTPLNFYLPVAIQASLLEGSHHLVLGGSGTARTEASQNFSFSLSNSDTFLHLMGIAGYRWQRPRDLVFLQAHLTPGVMLDPTPSRISSGEAEFRFGVGVLLGLRLK